MLPLVSRLPINLGDPDAKVGVSQAAVDNVVDESSVYVAEHAGGECLCDDRRIYRSFRLFTSSGLVMGHPVLLHCLFQLGDDMLGH